MDLKIFRSELWTAMYKLKVSVQKMVEPAMQAEGLSVLQGCVLFEIAREPQTVGSLSREFDQSQGNISTLCKNLEKSGFIKRERSKDDERVVTLSLDEKGNQALKNLRIYADKANNILKELPKERLEIIIGGIRELENLTGEIGKSLNK